MRRLVVPFVLAWCLVGGSIGVATAAPSKGCPDDAAGFSPVALDFTWQHGDPVPAPGVDPWWDLLVAAFADEGQTPESIAAALGLGSVADLYEYVVTQTRPVDKNGDGWICWKAYPDEQQAGGHYYNLADGNAAQH
jgi:hypothetical protein